MRVKLNDRSVAALKPAKRGPRYDVLDALMPGLAVHVTDKGSKTFVFRTRFPGNKNSRRLLGKVGAMSVEQARAKARDWHQMLDRGIDPGVRKVRAEQARLEALRSQQHNFLSVAEAYFAHVKAEKLAKASVIERIVRKELLPRWSAHPIQDTEYYRQDLAAVIKAAKARGASYQAHTLCRRRRSAFGCRAEVICSP